jgi:MFS family permease
MSLLATVAPALIGAAVPVISPNSQGLPGSDALTTLAGGLEFWALLAALVGLVLGAGAWALGAHSSNYQHAATGRKAVLVAGAAALVIGAAPALLSFFYTAGTGVHP